MGYTTIFEGAIHVDPPLNPQEVEFLNRFSSTRRMDRVSGPYQTEGEDEFPMGGSSGDILNYNTPPKGQPGLWCQWVASEDGQFIQWDGGEKFYSASEWMAYVIHHFFAPKALGKFLDARFAGFGDHQFNGEILAIGENPGDDVWLLRVESNKVSVIPASWPDNLIERLSGKEWFVRAEDMMGHSNKLTYDEANSKRVSDFCPSLGDLPAVMAEKGELDASIQHGQESSKVKFM